MTEQKEEKKLQAIIDSHQDVAKQTTKNAQGYLLVSRYHIQSKLLNAQKFGSPAGRTRAKKAYEKGYEPGRSGNKQKVNDSDESMLESWALHLMKEGYTIYTSTLRKMVYLFSS